MIDPKIFKAYDIRGIYPTQINEKNFELIIKGIYSFFVKRLKKDSPTIVLGRDMRLSGPTLFKIAKDTLLSLGATIIDVDLVSTPTFYFSVLNYQYDAGIQVSASHNPKEYNGIKFVIRDNKKIIKIGKATGMVEVKNLVLKEKFIKSKNKGVLLKKNNLTKDEVDFAFKIVKPTHIKPIKIVADPANAMAILYLEELFKNLPCQLIKMNFNLDGSFPSHQPDPMDFKNLRGLQKKVLETKANLGIAPDGDGDRVFFIDEKGNVIKASLITSIIVDEILKLNPKEKVLIDIRYTRNIANAVKKAGGIPIVGKIGHALITEHMIREDAIFCGESSAHYFYRSTGYAESAVITILYLLEIMGKEKRPISEIVNRYLSSYESGEFNFILNKNVEGKKLMGVIAKDYHNGEISWLDGISVDYPDWRFNIRASNTESLIRLNVEGDNKKITQSKLEELKAKIIKIGALLK